MKTYKKSTLQELYMCYYKFYTIGGIYNIDRADEIAKKIDKKDWWGITDVVSFAAKKHLPLETAIAALAIFGYYPKKYKAY